MRTTALLGTYGHCNGCIVPWNVTGAKCLAAGVGKGRSVGTTSSRLRSGFHCCDQSCISLTRSCKLSPCCEAPSDERSAGNLHATFCGSRGAGDPRPPGGNQQWLSLPRSWTGEKDDNFDIYVKLIGAGSPLRLTTDAAPRL